MKAMIGVLVVIMVMSVGGYISNIVKLVKCDFEPSYKAEIIRGIGIAVPPLVVVAGYLDLGN